MSGKKKTPPANNKKKATCTTGCVADDATQRAKCSSNAPDACPTVPKGGFGCEDTQIRQWCGRSQKGPCDNEEARRQLEVTRDPFSLATTEPKYPDGKAQWSMGIKLQKSTEIRDIHTAVVILFPGATNWMVAHEIGKREYTVNLPEKDSVAFDEAWVPDQWLEDVPICLANHCSNDYMRKHNYQTFRNRLNLGKYDTESGAPASGAYGRIRDAALGEAIPPDEPALQIDEPLNQTAVAPGYSVVWDQSEKQAFSAWRPVSIGMTIDCCGDSEHIDGYFESARVPVDTLLNELFGVAYCRHDDPDKPMVVDGAPDEQTDNLNRNTGGTRETMRKEVETWIAENPALVGFRNRPGNDVTAEEQAERTRLLQEKITDQLLYNYETESPGTYRAANCAPFMNFFALMAKDNWRWLRENPSHSIQKCEGMGRYTFQLNHVKEENRFLPFRKIEKYIHVPNLTGLPTAYYPPWKQAPLYISDPDVEADPDNDIEEAPPAEERAFWGAFCANHGLGAHSYPLQYILDDAEFEETYGLRETVWGHTDFRSQAEQHLAASYQGRVDLNPSTAVCQRGLKEDRIEHTSFVMHSTLYSAAPGEMTLHNQKGILGGDPATNRPRRVPIVRHDGHTAQFNPFEDNLISESMDAIVVVLRSFNGNNQFVIRTCCNQEFLVSDRSNYRNFQTKAYALEEGVQAVKEERKRFHKQAYHYMTASGEKSVFYDEV